MVLSTLFLLAHGYGARSVVWTNLPTPLNSSGLRVVDLVHPSGSASRLYRVAIEARDDQAVGGVRPHLRIQIASEGKSRPILVEPGGEDGSRLHGLIGLLRGRARLELVADRGWLDLGELPASGRAVIQLVGLLPAPFAFAEIDHLQSGPTEPISVRISRPDLPDAPATTAARVQLTRAAPVDPSETLPRLLFFVRSSALLSIALLLALGGLVLGWWGLAGDRAAASIVGLVSAAVVLHAVLLPPLQGADETSQAGTIEWLIWKPPSLRVWAYPASIARVADGLEQDRVQFHGGQALPLDARSRAGLGELLRSSLSGDAVAAAPFPVASSLQVVNQKGPLFYQPFVALGGAVRPLSILDRLAAYRLIATVWSLVGFAGGLALLGWAGLSRQVLLLYGILFLVPYVVAVTASCSNYGPAIGLGFLIAAGSLTAILAVEHRRRAVGASCAIAGAWLGVALWPDFVGLALLATAGGAVALLVEAATARGRGVRRPVPSALWLLLALAVLAVASLVFARARLPDFDPRLPEAFPRPGDERLPLLLLLTIAPGGLAALAALFRYRRRHLPRARRERAARWLSLAAAALLLVMFLLTPHSEVPYERTFLPLPGLIRAHLMSFWSNNFSWDQDRLGWKLWFGAFGWHDVFYPDAIYALARWGAVALAVSLPVLTVDFAVRRPAESSLLLLVSGAALSLAVASQLVRHAMSIHPQGRFFLPYLALAALPVLVQIERPGRTRFLEMALRLAVALQAWTAITVLGERYLLPG